MLEITCRTSNDATGPNTVTAVTGTGFRMKLKALCVVRVSNNIGARGKGG